MSFTEEKIGEEYHEHPFFNGQYHKAVWCKTWTSSGSSDEAPNDVPITCTICGRVRDGN